MTPDRRRRPGEGGGASTSGLVSQDHDTSQPWPFPVAGPRRVVAISRLRQAIAADVVAQLDALAFAGWLDPADPDTVSILAASWHAVVANAVSDALDRLRALENGSGRGECQICFAVIEQGKCWGCGEPPGRGVS